MKRIRTYPRPEHIITAHNSRFYKDGFVILPLKDVLAILNLRIKYTVDAFKFYDSETGDLVFVSQRAIGGHTPFDALRARGLLAPATFEPLAEAYMPLPEPEEEAAEEVTEEAA
jgi:hypothetical protein